MGHSIHLHVYCTKVSPLVVKQESMSEAEIGGVQK